VALSEALDVLHQAMSPPSYRRIGMVIKIASNLPAFLSSSILIVPITIAKDHDSLARRQKWMQKWHPSSTAGTQTIRIGS
jgi:hypothetical protein